MPRYLGNFPNIQTFMEFPKYPVIYKISKTLKIFEPLIPIGIWKIPKIPGNLGIPQIPQNLGNFPNSYFLQKYNCCSCTAHYIVKTLPRRVDN